MEAEAGWHLGRAAVCDVIALVLAVVRAILLLRFRVDSAWLVLGGAILGLIACSVTGI